MSFSLPVGEQSVAHRVADVVSPVEVNEHDV